MRAMPCQPSRQIRWIGNVTASHEKNPITRLVRWEVEETFSEDRDLFRSES
jgi:hypothetical protein